MNNRNQLVILYGSQTGNSQDLAERVWRQAKQFNLVNTHICSLDEYGLTNLNTVDKYVLIVCSTTGQGDVPDNMLRFWKSIMRKTLSLNSFENLNFSIIGLGDSSYAKYNFVAKKLFKRLVQLGARYMLENCLCDEQTSYEGPLGKWLNEFWTFFNIVQDDYMKANSAKQLPYLYEILEQSAYPNDDAHSQEFCNAKLLSNKRVTSQEHWQDVRLIEFQCELKYEAGDVVVILPENSAKNVTQFYGIFQHLDLDPNKLIKVKSNSKQNFKTNSNIQTVNDLVAKYFDLNSVPRVSFFHTLSKYSYTNELENEKLKEFVSSPDGLEDLYEYCHRPRRTIIEIFDDFPHTTKNLKTLNDLINLIPEIKPREFSIASNCFKHSNRLQILVAIVEYKTRLYEKRRGTCSTWLATLDPTCHVSIPVRIKKGTFNVDLSIDRPIVCIGPGTGVAPFRNIIFERIAKYNSKRNILYFGCRSKHKDFYFQDDWQELERDGSLILHTAFSTDQDFKVYVQDKILEDSAEIFDLIYHSNALVLIAGSSKRMPQDVVEALRKVIETEYEKHAILTSSNLADVDYRQFSENYIKQLESSKRLQLETWS